jgi:WD40 repeat protein
VAFATSAGEVVVVDSTTGERRWSTRAHQGRALSIAFSPKAPGLATGGEDGRARLFDVEGKALAELPAKTSGWVERVAWSPDGERLATASGRHVRLWSARGEPFLETEAHESTVLAIGWRRDGRQLASCCYGGVHLWPIERGATARHLAWKGSLISLAWSPDGKVIACGSQDRSVHFWRLATGNDSEMSGYPFKPRALGWDAASSLLATAGDATVTLWDFRGKGPEGTRPIQLEGHKALCTVLTFAPKAGILATGAEEGGVLLWEPRKGNRPTRFAFLEDQPTALVWSPRADALIGADSGGHVVCWAVG